MLGIALGGAALLAAASANGAIAYFVPAKLVTQGTATSPTLAGTVVLQVLVKADGSFKVQHIIRSTNHADDAAALEVASSSTYRPATRGAAKLTSYYDFTLKFTSAGVSKTSSGAQAGASDRYLRMIEAGNYTGAQTELKSYLAQHPDDSGAQLDLGIDDTFLNDYVDAAAAFERAGSIPPNYHGLAVKAYNEAAPEVSKSGDNAAALVYAQKAVALDSGLFTYNTLGFVQMSAGDFTSAVISLEKARQLAQADLSVKASDKAQIDGNLSNAYLEAGNPVAALRLANEAKGFDPTSPAAQTAFANYYIQTAKTDVAAGKLDDAVAAYEQAAAVVPAQAAQFYTESSYAYLSAKPPQNDKAKAEADKALALAPDDARANYAAGVALANQTGKAKDALVYLNKADASAKKAGDSALATQIESVITQLNATK